MEDKEGRCPSKASQNINNNLNKYNYEARICIEHLRRMEIV